MAEKDDKKEFEMLECSNSKCCSEFFEVSFDMSDCGHTTVHLHCVECGNIIVLSSRIVKVEE